MQLFLVDYLFLHSSKYKKNIYNSIIKSSRINTTKNFIIILKK